MRTELQKKATWQNPDPQQLMEWATEWSAAAGVDSATELADFKQQLDSTGQMDLQVSIELIARLFPATEPTVRMLELPPVDTGDWKQFVDPRIFSDADMPESATRQLQLAVGCWFAIHHRFDAAVELLQPLRLEQVVAPADLLFYLGLSQHRLLQGEACQATLKRLLENEGTLPRRFESIARLMISDIQALEKDSLDEIARLMQDITRRQSLHRSGTRVIEQEKQVIAKLDQMIEELEKKMQQQQAASGAQPSQGSADPMQDSQIARGRGTGDVTERPTTDGGEWGSLPARKRAAALAEMAKDMPPHYREVIEEYFRQLAREPGKKN